MGNRKITVVEPDGTVKTVGWVQGHVLHMKRDRQIHFYRKLQGWAIDEEKVVRNPDAIVYCIRTTDENDNPISFIATRDDMIAYGKPIDHGRGPQLCLPLRHWTSYTE